MAKVGIVMGSDSDMPIMSKAADILEKLGIDYEIKIISAHREPDVFFEYAKTAEEKGFKTESLLNQNPVQDKEPPQPLTATAFESASTLTRPQLERAAFERAQTNGQDIKSVKQRAKLSRFLG